jgi:AraC family transcriptional regulator, activator of mtrCDE
LVGLIHQSLQIYLIIASDGCIYSSNAGQYLTWWRMQLAWSLLRSGESTAEVVDKVGYKFESAFSRIFHKTFSLAAGKVRRGIAA